MDRRTFNFGPKYPGEERRMKKDRRQGWERRYEWKPIDHWSSFSIPFEIP